MPVKGESKGLAWIQAHLSHQGDDCLTWPWPIKGGSGYGIVCIPGGKTMQAHRLMCELLHGPAPSRKHHASHSCGNGHQGCVNPRHISWKTVSENQLDRARHGTKSMGCAGKLTPEQARQIKLLKGRKTQAELAAMFGVSRSTISWVHCGRTWRDERQRSVAKPRSVANPTHQSGTVETKP